MMRSLLMALPLLVMSTAYVSARELPRIDFSCVMDIGGTVRFDDGRTIDDLVDTRRMFIYEDLFLAIEPLDVVEQVEILLSIADGLKVVNIKWKYPQFERSHIWGVMMSSLDEKYDNDDGMLLFFRYLPFAKRALLLDWFEDCTEYEGRRRKLCEDIVLESTRKFTESDVARLDLPPDVLLDWHAAKPFERYFRYVKRLDKERRFYEYWRVMNSIGVGGFGRYWDCQKRWGRYSEEELERMREETYYAGLVESEPMPVIGEYIDYIHEKKMRTMFYTYLVYRFGSELGEVGQKMYRFFPEVPSLWIYSDDRAVRQKLKDLLREEIEDIKRPGIRDSCHATLVDNIRSAHWVGDEETLELFDQLEEALENVSAAPQAVLCIKRAREALSVYKKKLKERL